MNLCLEALTAADAEPYELVEIAADNGVREISVFTAPIGGGQHDIVGDTHARRETKSRCEALGVQISLVEGFLLNPFMADSEIDALLPRLETAAWLNARSVNVLTYEQKTGQPPVSAQELEQNLLDRFRYFCNLADKFDLNVLTELSKRMILKTVPQGAAFLRQLEGRVQLNIDSLHFFRNNGKPEELTAAKALIGHCQLSDGPATMAEDRQFYEALSQRLYPGEGELPLKNLLKALPQEISLGLEIPRQDLMDAGFTPAQRCQQAVRSARNFLS